MSHKLMRLFETFPSGPWSSSAAPVCEVDRHRHQASRNRAGDEGCRKYIRLAAEHYRWPDEISLLVVEKMCRWHAEKRVGTGTLQH